LLAGHDVPRWWAERVLLADIPKSISLIKIGSAKMGSIFGPPNFPIAQIELRI